MLKLRLEGTKDEIDWLIEGLRKTYDVRSVSKLCPNRDGQTFRAYVEVLAFFVRSGSSLDSKTSASPSDNVERTPRPGDMVLGGGDKA